MKTFLFCLLSVAVFCLAIYTGILGDPSRLSLGFLLYAMTRFLTDKRLYRIILYIPFGLFTVYIFWWKFVDSGDFYFFENVPFLIVVPIALFFPIDIKKNKWRNLAFIVLLSAVLYPFWFNYNTLINSDRMEKELPEGIRFQNPDGTAFDRAAFDNKTVVLNFFTERCGYCFDEMPHYEELKNRNRSNGNLEIISVLLSNKREKTDSEEELLREMSAKYSFRLLRSEKTADEVFETLGFRGVPHCVVLKGNTMIYSGWFNHRWYNLVHNINWMVKQ